MPKNSPFVPIAQSDNIYAAESYHIYRVLSGTISTSPETPLLVAAIYRVPSGTISTSPETPLLVAAASIPLKGMTAYNIPARRTTSG
jgi:hypothetical protein